MELSLYVTQEEGEQDDDYDDVHDDANDGDGVVNAKNVQDIHSHHVKYYNSKRHQGTQTELSALL